MKRNGKNGIIKYKISSFLITEEQYKRKRSNIRKVGEADLKQKLGQAYPFVCTLPVLAVLWVGLYIASIWLEPTDIMGYSLLAFYMVLPLGTLISCIYVASHGGMGTWICPVLYSLLLWTLPIAVTGVYEPFFLLLTFVPGVLGVLIGHIWRRISSKKEK